jgi:hypothetical protein
MVEIQARASHFRAILRRPILSIFAAIFALLSAVTWIRDEFLSEASREALKIPNLLPSLSWYWWAILALLTFVVGIIEGSFRLHREKVGIFSFYKPIVSNIILLRALSDIEPLRIIFDCAKDISRLRVVLEYSAFVNGQFWTKPRHIELADMHGAVHGKRFDLLLICREESKDPRVGIHWGAPTKAGEPYTDLVHGGLYRARIRFIGDKASERQNYYFMAVLTQMQDNTLRVEVIPHQDLSFINDWELGRI